METLIVGTNSTITILSLSGNADDIYGIFGFTLEKIRFVWSCAKDILGLGNPKQCQVFAKGYFKCKKHFSIRII